MAVLHRATLSPSKPELLTSWLDRQPWGGAGPLEVVGSYRYDDPDGEVGVEGFLVRRGDALLHAVLTYRGEPLDGGEPHLVGTLEHSVLGRRWVYDGRQDPVARGCLSRALAGEQEQAALEVYEGDELVARRDPDVRIGRRTEPGSTDGELQVASVLDGRLAGQDRLVATWSGGDAVVAAR